MDNGDPRDVLHPGGPDVHDSHFPWLTSMSRRRRTRRGPRTGLDHARYVPRPVRPCDALPAQGAIALFPESPMIHHSPTGSMMRHLVSDARTGTSACGYGLRRLERQPQIVGVMGGFVARVRVYPCYGMSLLRMAAGRLGRLGVAAVIAFGTSGGPARGGRCAGCAERPAMVARVLRPGVRPVHAATVLPAGLG